MIRRRSLFQIHVPVSLLALCCLLLLPNVLRAQPSMSARDMRRQQQQAMRDREYALYHAGEVHEQREAAARNLMPQIREDFKQLQVINNGLMKQVVTAKALDYKLIAQTVGEINNRAGRLKDNLALPQLQTTEDNARKGKTQEVAPDAAQLKAALFELDRLIMNFVTNPHFNSSPNTLAVAQADRAGRDLRSIITLSRALKKSAQQLGK
jgi:hypothetical protein